MPPMWCRRPGRALQPLLSACGLPAMSSEQLSLLLPACRTATLPAGLIAPYARIWRMTIHLTAFAVSRCNSTEAAPLMMVLWSAVM